MTSFDLDCCESGTSRGISRRSLLVGAATFSAWAYLPKFARAADGRDPRLVTIILRGALDGLATVAPVGDPDYADLHGSIALTRDGPNAATMLDSFFALHPSMPQFARMYRDRKAAVVHAVATAYRSAGIGALVVNELVAQARLRRIKTVFALTRAVKFFLRLGFVITDKERFPEKVWRDCVKCPLVTCCDETAVVLE